MTAPTPAVPADQQPAAPTADPATPPATPPWGDSFDPARAWNTIQTLREAEKERDQLRRQVMTPEQQQQLAEYNTLLEASKSEAQRKDEAIAAAQREAETARNDAVRYKAAATYGISADHFDLLGSGTEQEVTTRAEKIAALIAAQQAATPPPAAPPTGRPVEQLRPGATPAGALDEDEVIYQSLFGPPK